MKRRRLTKKDKEEIGLQCCNCGSKEDLQYHHIVPVVIGGKDINSNMCCLCYDCHYKLHHDGKESKVNNHSELIKKGQARAKEEGRNTGKPPQQIYIVREKDGKVIKELSTCTEFAQLIGVRRRQVTNWANGIKTGPLYKKYGILEIKWYKGLKIA
ncbi:HNH endonuclease [Clostridium butyricum]|uniref:HNH endonuclease n=1 Tax=Clostridium butyricum TaxID=1492 RepID=UPI00325C1C7F